jgi:acyl-CoA reductase-like NAD-dependent aldehyde dehydrogenase
MRGPITGGVETLDGVSSKKILAPYDDAILEEIAYASSEQLTDAIKAAHTAFAVSRIESPEVRSARLAKISQLIAERKELFADSITAESGKPITYSRIEVDRAVYTFAAAAKEAKTAEDPIHLDFSDAPNGKDRTGHYRYFPTGTVAAITPFNFPLNLVAHKVAPALAVGNTIILKPAPQTPLTSYLLADVIADAGVPSGFFSLLPCDNDVAEALVKHSDIKVVSFTGSAKVGWYLKSLVPKKKVTLELGGNGAVIINDWNDIDSILPSLITAAFYYAGQVCISLQRLFIKAELYDEVLARFIEAARSIVVGDPRDPATVVGPMISPDAVERVENWIADAVKLGAVQHCGEIRKPKFITPTILTNVPETCDLSCEEVFAPVVIVEKYSRIEDVIDKLNASRYGLQVGLFSKDQTLIDTVYRDLNVGGLIVGDTNAFRIDTMPYGGVKDSGFGREGIIYAMREMTEMKLLVSRV